jgi:hypothetical protein
MAEDFENRTGKPFSKPSILPNAASAHSALAAHKPAEESQESELRSAYKRATSRLFLWRVAILLLVPHLTLCGDFTEVFLQG